MAIKYSVVNTRNTEYWFLPEDITIDPELNGRHELPDIDWLIQDILAKGQLQPVMIRSDGGKPVLAFGFSRWRAISEINNRGMAGGKLKIRCVPFRGNAQEAFLANISENRVRNATTPLDDAHNIAKLEKWGKTVDEIAAVYHETPRWVRDRLSLLSLGDDARIALKEGKIKPSAAVAIAKLAEAQQREVVASGRKVTVASLKPPRFGFTELKEVLRMVSDEGQLPDGFETTPEGQDAIDEFCQFLLAKLKGK